MKLKILLPLTCLLIGNAAMSQNNYLPTSTGKVGINLSSAPTLFPLEVAGGIGINFGDAISLRDASFPSANRRLLQTGWNSNSGGFDYVSFFTPGASSTNNANEKMTITGTGKISMGLSISNGQLPEAKLHVHQDEALASAQFSNLVLTRTSGNYGVVGSRIAHSTWLIRHTTGTAWTTVYYKDGLSVDASFLNPQADVKTWWDRDPNNDVQSWGTNTQTYMQINQGKVGVNINAGATLLADRGRFQVEEGTAYNGSTPTKAFVVRTDHTSDYAYAMVADVNRDQTVAFTVSNRNFAGTGTTKYPFTVKGNGQVIISSALPENISATPPVLEPVFLVQDATSQNGDINFKIFKSGTTVIGKRRVWNTHNDAKLAVDGKIVSQEVVVTQQNWSDFVFDKDYKMLPLNKLENFYKENHHLPNVPSAKEIEENGNDLGKTDAILLRKIEELTIYIVELQKQIEDLKSKSNK